MRGKILHIAQWVFIGIISMYLLVGHFTPEEEPPKKEVYYLNLEQFPDGTFYLQYAIEGHIEQVGFVDWDRFIEYTTYLKSIYNVDERVDLYQHIEKLDVRTGGRR